MRPKCKCGAISDWWYAPIIYKKMTYDEYLHAHAFCGECADTENWAEYMYIGFHKNDWQWLNKKKSIASLNKWNEYLSKPFWDVSHIREDGKRWHYARYRCMETLKKETGGLVGVEIKEGWY